MINKTKKEKVLADDYIYVSAMIRTRENHRVNRDALLRMADAKDLAEIEKMLPEYKIEPIYSSSGLLDGEATGTGYLREEFAAVSEAMPKPELLDFLKYSYDCHNLKTYIKCTARERSDSKDLFIDLGSVSADLAISAIKSEKLDVFPKNMAEAFGKANKAFAESGDPKLIDSILDSACYADMLSLASAFNNKFFADLVKIKIDTTNIMTALRIIRMNDKTGLFSDMFISGGTLDFSFFKKAMTEGEETFFVSLASTDYRQISADSSKTLTSLGKACNSVYMKEANRAKNVSFGAEVCISYLIKAEYTVKMLRTVIAAKQTGVSPEKIKESIGIF